MVSVIGGYPPCRPFRTSPFRSVLIGKMEGNPPGNFVQWCYFVRVEEAEAA